jgi:hypothetical protein
MPPQADASLRTSSRPNDPHIGLKDYVGVIHIHTRYSDGGDDMAAVVDHARDAGLNFVVVSDHDRLTAREHGWEGWHGGVLVIVAAEVTAKAGHCLALKVDTVEGYKRLPVPVFLDAIDEQGGFAFIAHPKGNVKRELTINVKSWRNWSVDTFAGIEVWPYMHDWVGNINLLNLHRAYRNPDGYITGPLAEVVQLWDELGLQRRVVGIGSLDSHSRGVPFNWFPIQVMRIFPLDRIFRTVRTHLLMEPFSGEATKDIEQAIAAMVRGRCFFDYLPLGDGAGFSFGAEQRDGRIALMGDEVPAGDWSFAASSPVLAHIGLLRNGQPIAAVDGTQLEWNAHEPGVYRVEARVGGRPWLYTNPIYLR